MFHIYVDHDGTPFVDGHRPSADPTPRRPIGLELMAMDTTPSLYLGRPCHYRVDESPPCGVLVYTHQRYSEQVVESMTTALRRFLSQHADYRRIVLIGYSGGGTLATLMAARLSDVAAVVTLAANLDVAEWTRRHDYSPLEGSLDPMRDHGPPDSVLQWHYVGSADDNVPPAVVRSYASTHAAAEVVELPGVDHACCWKALWPDILKRLDRTEQP